MPDAPVSNDRVFEQLDALRVKLKTTEVERNRFRQELQFLAQKYTELEESNTSSKYEFG